MLRTPDRSGSTDSSNSAYLVIRRGGRWTDVFRLLPGRRAIIGRSSQSQIIVRSDQCSRSHAELYDEAGSWMIRDLGSRNGTLVDNEPIAGPHALREGEAISVAGHQMTFVHHLTDAFSVEGATAAEDARGEQQTGAQRSEDQRTADQIEATVITERRVHTSFLDPTADRATPPAAISLFRTAIELGRCETPEQAAAATLEAVSAAAGVASGAVLMLARKTAPPDPAARTATKLTALATRCQPERSYRRLPDSVAATVLGGGEAILARNLVNDVTLTSPDSRGELSTSSILCAPVRVRDSIVGLLHLYSSADEPELHTEHLEFALAAAANLGLALEHLWRQRRLAHHLHRSEQRVAQLREQLADRVEIIGRSKSLRAIEQQIARAAPTGATVLVRGESGVGKELIAAAIHHASPRRDGPFLCLNCAALSPSLLESELFGHEKGAFTGATDRKIGKFEAADGGTLMLDEIGEMQPEIQAKFLRVLEGQPFERVGGNTPIRADVRVVAATNRDLEQAIAAGEFRSDLYFRLHVLELRVPPLRERGDDVVLLAEHFLTRFCSEMGRRLEGFSQAAQAKLLAYRWPGNIRELKNTVERAVVLSAGPIIEANDLLLSELRLPSPSGGAAGGGKSAGEPSSGGRVDGSGSWLSLAELEQQHIEAVLRHTEGNKSRAAKILGIERSTLDRKLKRWQD
ncbi:sigma 54-interacting transcriptional regulator [Candidatus Laterigemmans baculatus]|uniref:sigma 54-interacting transcriptional regulator n=1 Tax=Candidatus Laterigemmans baculatus TaxID=2770505 RepID=UPI0013DC7F05|nr:sigma 54-interacting transcriptional regulator [Candidatus Laterigemmans baculatus]